MESTLCQCCDRLLHLHNRLSVTERNTTRNITVLTATMVLFTIIYCPILSFRITDAMGILTQALSLYQSFLGLQVFLLSKYRFMTINDALMNTAK